MASGKTKNDLLQRLSRQQHIDLNNARRRGRGRLSFLQLGRPPNIAAVARCHAPLPESSLVVPSPDDEQVDHWARYTPADHSASLPTPSTRGIQPAPLRLPTVPEAPDSNQLFELTNQQLGWTPELDSVDTSRYSDTRPLLSDNSSQTTLWSPLSQTLFPTSANPQWSASSAKSSSFNPNQWSHISSPQDDRTNRTYEQNAAVHEVPLDPTAGFDCPVRAGPDGAQRCGWKPFKDNSGGFPSISRMREHVGSHGLPCPDCDRAFKVPAKYKSHRKFRLETGGCSPVDSEPKENFPYLISLPPEAVERFFRRPRKGASDDVVWYDCYKILNPSWETHGSLPSTSYWRNAEAEGRLEHPKPSAPGQNSQESLTSSSGAGSLSLLDSTPAQSPTSSSSSYHYDSLIKQPSNISNGIFPLESARTSSPVGQPPGVDGATQPAHVSIWTDTFEDLIDCSMLDSTDLMPGLDSDDTTVLDSIPRNAYASVPPISTATRSDPTASTPDLSGNIMSAEPRLQKAAQIPATGSRPLQPDTYSAEPSGMQSTPCQPNTEKQTSAEGNRAKPSDRGRLPSQVQDRIPLDGTVSNGTHLFEQHTIQSNGDPSGSSTAHDHRLHGTIEGPSRLGQTQQNRLPDHSSSLEDHRSLVVGDCAFSTGRRLSQVNRQEDINDADTETEAFDVATGSLHHTSNSGAPPATPLDHSSSARKRSFKSSTFTPLVRKKTIHRINQTMEEVVQAYNKIQVLATQNKTLHAKLGTIEVEKQELIASLMHIRLEVNRWGFGDDMAVMAC